MPHDDGDWDSEVGSAILEFLLYGDDGIAGWKVTVLLLLIAGGLLLWHHYG